MRRVLLAVVVGGILLVSGCSSGIHSGSSTPTQSQTPSPSIDCGTFGTGGVAMVAEVNTTITAREDATSALQAARANDSLHAENDTQFSYVPREKVDEEARSDLRDRRRSISENETLYYYSPDGGTDIDEMVVVSETGRIYRPYVGAC